MTEFRFEVIVKLKDGLLDPQGKAIEDSLPHMGWSNVSEVRVGKRITLTVEADDLGTAARQVKEIAHSLLANPVIEDVGVQEQRGWTMSPPPIEAAAP